MTSYKNKTGEEVLLEKMEQDMERLEKKIDSGFLDIKSTIKSDFVRKEEFEPIKKIVYGLVGITLTGVMIALIALVINQ